MHELLPVAIGVIVAGATLRIQTPRLRIAALVVLALLGGTLASWVNGELAESWGFISVDTFLVLISAVAVTVILVAWQRRKALSPVRK